VAQLIQLKDNFFLTFLIDAKCALDIVTFSALFAFEWWHFNSKGQAG